VFVEAQEAAPILVLTTTAASGICDSHALLASISLYKTGEELYLLWFRSVPQLAYYSVPLEILCSLLQQHEESTIFSHPDLVAFWIYFRALVNQAQGSGLKGQVSDPQDGVPCKKLQDLTTPQEIFNDKATIKSRPAKT